MMFDGSCDSCPERPIHGPFSAENEQSDSDDRTRGQSAISCMEPSSKTGKMRTSHSQVHEHVMTIFELPILTGNRCPVRSLEAPVVKHGSSLRWPPWLPGLLNAVRFGGDVESTVGTGPSKISICRAQTELGIFGVVCVCARPLLALPCLALRASCACLPAFWLAGLLALNHTLRFMLARVNQLRQSTLVITGAFDLDLRKRKNAVTEWRLSQRS